MYKIPQYLHRPSQILWFESDEFVILLISLIFGFTMGLVMLGAGIAGFLGYKKIKKQYPRGFFRHIPYLLGFKTFERFPHVFITDFHE